jgi:cell pole-organizing protein PopZ
VNNANGNANARTEESVISYHEIAPDADVIPNNDVDQHDSTITDDATDYNDPDMNDTVNGTTDECEADVMAAIIAEVTAETELDQFVGASFALLQDVDDVYENDEPDIVCYAHVVNSENDNGVDIPDFVADANNNAEAHNERITARRVTVTRNSDFLKDFELMIYHAAQRVMHTSSRDVGIVHYVDGRPDIISNTYGRDVPESIIDYSDVLRFKFKKAGIHDVTTLMSILSNRTDSDAMAALKLKFHAVGLKGINTSTVKILREEINRSLAHCDFNCH